MAKTAQLSSSATQLLFRCETNAQIWYSALLPFIISKIFPRLQGRLPFCAKESLAGFVLIREASSYRQVREVLRESSTRLKDVSNLFLFCRDWGLRTW
jgi:hypothetical protein